MAEKEYIERAALLNYPIRIHNYDEKNGNENFVYGVESVLDYAQDIPAADVVEVVHSAWVWTEEGEADYEKYWVCPICGEKSYIHHNYCSNCGTKMDEEVRGGDTLDT